MTAGFRECLASKAFPRDTCKTFYFANLSYLIHQVSTHTIYTHITHILRGVLFKEKTLAIILESNDYSTFDTHTQHTRLFFNECLFHLCDCTCSNVMCILNCLSIKPKTIFEYFICFWKCFCAFVFWVFVQIAFFMFFIKNSFRGIFARNSWLSSSQENGLRQNMKTKNLNKNFCDCFATVSRVKSYRKKFCASKAFFVSNFARS